MIAAMGLVERCLTARETSLTASDASLTAEWGIKEFARANASEAYASEFLSFYGIRGCCGIPIYLWGVGGVSREY